MAPSKLRDTLQRDLLRSREDHGLLLLIILAFLSADRDGRLSARIPANVPGQYCPAMGGRSARGVCAESACPYLYLSEYGLRQYLVRGPSRSDDLRVPRRNSRNKTPASQKLLRIDTTQLISVDLSSYSNRNIAILRYIAVDLDFGGSNKGKRPFDFRGSKDRKVKLIGFNCRPCGVDRQKADCQRAGKDRRSNSPQLTLPVLELVFWRRGP